MSNKLVAELKPHVPTPKDNEVTPVRAPANEADLISIELQLARSTSGLSISDLSKLTGISKTVLHGYERGRTKPGAREIRLLSAALNISPNRLILGNDVFETDTPRFTSIYRKIKARPQLGSVLALMYMPFITSLLAEDELGSLLTLVDALVKAKSPEIAENFSIMADEVSNAIEQMTLPDGTLTIPPEQLQLLITNIQARVADRLGQRNSKTD